MDFGAIGEQMQLDVVVFGGSAGEHGTDEPRFEIREHLHGRERGATLPRQGLTVLRAAEQPVILGQRILDLAVLGQHRSVGNAEALGGLALGREEIADALLRHDARGFLRERAPQILGTWRQFLHDQKIGSGLLCCESGEVGIDVLRACTRITDITFFRG